MEKDIGIGVIGIGMGLHLICLNGDPGTRFAVKRFCAARPDKVKRAGKETGIDFVTADYQDLLKRSRS
jgi:predicted dehydrogenase